MIVDICNNIYFVLHQHDFFLSYLSVENFYCIMKFDILKCLKKIGFTTYLCPSPDYLVAWIYILFFTYKTTLFYNRAIYRP